MRSENPLPDLDVGDRGAGPESGLSQGLMRNTVCNVKMTRVSAAAVPSNSARPHAARGRRDRTSQPSAARQTNVTGRMIQFSMSQP